MHALSITSAILATALLSSAKPTGTSNLVPRGCSTIFPTFIDHIDEQNPTTSTNDMNVAVGLAANDGAFFHRDVLVRFDNIPADAYGCQLDATFPTGAAITGTGATQVHIFSLDRLATATDTYATSPNKGSLFGSIVFTADPNGPITSVIGSETCAPSLSYRLTLASDNKVGDVSFAEIVGMQGLKITYNC